MTRLGSGRSVPVLYWRGGATRIGPLPGMTSLKYGRVMGGTGVATFTATANATTRDFLGSIHPWAMELVVFRDGDRVWEGPVVLPTWQGEVLSLTAWDVTGFNKRRAHRGRVSLTPVDVLTELTATITAGLTLDDPGVLAHLTSNTVDGTVVNVARDVAPWSGYYGDDAEALAKQGASYTAIGRRIHCWRTDAPPARLRTLDPSKHIAGQSQITEDGTALATQVIAVNSDIVGTASISVPVDPYYGLVELITSADSVTDTAGASAVAARLLRASYPAPQSLSLPGGVALNADAPYSLASLVPGVVIPVADASTPRRMQATPVLTAVDVSQDPGGEQVTITLVPPDSEVP